MRHSKEVLMKKTYATPVMAPSGEIVRDTRTGTVNGCEISGGAEKREDCAGSVGYYL
jgi:hypothetical protein